MTNPIIKIIEEDSEADTCRKEVLPKIYESNWTDDQILEQRTFTDGKIIVIGRKASRKIAKLTLAQVCDLCHFNYCISYSTYCKSAPIIKEEKHRSQTCPSGDALNSKSNNDNW